MSIRKKGILLKFIYRFYGEPKMVFYGITVNDHFWLFMDMDFFYFKNVLKHTQTWVQSRTLTS